MMQLEEYSYRIYPKENGKEDKFKQNSFPTA